MRTTTVNGLMNGLIFLVVLLKYLDNYLVIQVLGSKKIWK